MTVFNQTKMNVNWLNHPESSSGQVMTIKKIKIYK